MSNTLYRKQDNLETPNPSNTRLNTPTLRPTRRDLCGWGSYEPTKPSNALFIGVVELVLVLVYRAQVGEVDLVS